MWDKVKRRGVGIVGRHLENGGGLLVGHLSGVYVAGVASGAAVNLCLSSPICSFGWCGLVF